jgi:hypothetical protein
MIAESKKLLCFRCTKVDSVNHLINNVPKDRILHLKGFGQRINERHHIPFIIYKWMKENYDIFIFDGDDLRLDSFTKHIVILSTLLDSTTQKFIAFKCAVEEGTFLSSWNNRYVSIDFTSADGASPMKIELFDIPMRQSPRCSPRVQRKVKNDAFREDVEEFDDLAFSYPSPHTIPISYQILNETDYTKLGVAALKTTGSQRVFTIGGGAIVKKEFNESPPAVMWYIYNVTRSCLTESIPARESREGCHILKETQAFMKEPEYVIDKPVSGYLTILQNNIL